MPVSNINRDLFQDIFGENMIYSNAIEMTDMINNGIVNYKYQSPNKDVLTIEYWKRKIEDRVNILRK